MNLYLKELINGVKRAQIRIEKYCRTKAYAREREKKTVSGKTEVMPRRPNTARTAFLLLGVLQACISSLVPPPDKLARDKDIQR